MVCLGQVTAALSLKTLSDLVGIAAILQDYLTTWSYTVRLAKRSLLVKVLNLRIQQQWTLSQEINSIGCAIFVLVGFRLWRIIVFFFIRFILLFIILIYFLWFFVLFLFLIFIFILIILLLLLIIIIFVLVGFDSEARHALVDTQLYAGILLLFVFTLTFHVAGGRTLSKLFDAILVIVIFSLTSLIFEIFNFFFWSGVFFVWLVHFLWVFILFIIVLLLLFLLIINNLFNVLIKFIQTFMDSLVDFLVVEIAIVDAI